MEKIHEHICEESIQQGTERKTQQIKSNSNSYFVRNDQVDEKALNKIRLEDYKRSHLNFHKLFKKCNNNKKKETLTSLRNLKIEDIIPKNKLTSKEDNIIFFKGELFKYATPKSNLNNQLCYRKFFVLDRRFLRYHYS